MANSQDGAAAITLPKRARAIVVLTPWFPNRPGDRNASYIYESAMAVAHRGVDVHVLVCRPWVPPGLARFAPEWMAGVLETSAFDGLASVQIVRYLGFPRGSFRPLTNWFQRKRVVPALKGLVQRSGASLIHAQTEGMAPIAVAVARVLKCPGVVTIHGLNTDKEFLHAPRQKAMLRKALAMTDRVILVGEPLRGVFAELAGREDNICVVQNGVRIPQDVDRLPILSGQDPVRFVSVSYLNEGKGIDIALRALAAARNSGFEEWRYTIIGGGEEFRSLVDLTSSLGLNSKVFFLGFQPHDRVFGLLREADVFVLPSYREAFGIAYLEAMVSGLLTIGVRGQGPSAFIEDGVTGLLVEPRDPQSLAACLLAIPRKRLDMQKIAMAGCQMVKEAFTWDAHARRLIDVYGGLVDW
ncbi:MAG: glycosyltransferase family 4 protein [Proteobacteria bacterium]|nr:glycosyltransferase family 4 protein [Pseudomonadota bacterium]